MYPQSLDIFQNFTENLYITSLAHITTVGFNLGTIGSLNTEARLQSMSKKSKWGDSGQFLPPLTYWHFIGSIQSFTTLQCNEI